MERKGPVLLVVLNIFNILFGLWVTLSCLVMKTLDNRINILIGGLISFSIGIVLFFVIWFELALDYIDY